MTERLKNLASHADLNEHGEIVAVDFRQRTKITDAGLVHLEGLRSLQALLLGGTQTTGAGVAKLQKALTECDITH